MPSGLDYSLDFEYTDFREQAHLYRVGKGEQGVLSVGPFKFEILPHWRFRTEEVARESAERILGMLHEYREHDDFVGMDMARKFLQMWATPARDAMPTTAPSRSTMEGRVAAAENGPPRQREGPRGRALQGAKKRSGWRVTGRPLRRSRLRHGGSEHACLQINSLGRRRLCARLHGQLFVRSACSARFELITESASSRATCKRGQK